MGTSFLIGWHDAGGKRLVVETAQEAVDIRLRVLVFVAFARVTEITVVSQLFQILLLDVQFLHQRLVVIKKVSAFMIRWRQFLLSFYDAENLFEQLPIA